MADEFDWIERERGILTERDREILTSDEIEDLSQNAINQRYHNIRNRLRNAVYDFHIISRHLPLRDIRQIFEPAYDWSRERRKLNEQGRRSTSPPLSIFLRCWLNLFEFYTYGMVAGQMEETRGLMRDLVTAGMERGLRLYQHENRQTYQEPSVAMAIEYGNRMLQRNYLWQIKNDLSSEPDEAAEQVIRLYRQRKIPYSVASQWIEEFVKNPQ